MAPYWEDVLIFRFAGLRVLERFCFRQDSWEVKFPCQISLRHILFMDVAAKFLKFHTFSWELFECNEGHILACWLTQSAWWEVKPTCQVTAKNADLEPAWLYSTWILPHLLPTCKWGFIYCPLIFTSGAFSSIIHTSGDSHWAWESQLRENVELLCFSV